jgi:Tat protein secretion system quality control protein TatD with DNase activity
MLEAQLRLAKRYDLPVILHSRRTHDTLAMLLKNMPAENRRGAWFRGKPAAGGTFCSVRL